MVKAKEIMTRNVLTVREGTPIEKAIELLAELSVTGLPVVNEYKNLLGVITEQDVMHLFFDESSLIFSSQTERNKTVRDYMTTPAVFFDENEGVLEVCKCLQDSHFRRVPIVAHGMLTGVISRQDIIKYVLRQRRNNFRQ